MKATVWGTKRKKTAPTLKEPTIGRETWQAHRSSAGKQPCNHRREVLGSCSSWAGKGSLCGAEPWRMHHTAVGWKPGREQRHQAGVWGQVWFGRGLAMEVEGGRQRGCWGLWQLWGICTWGNRKLGAIDTPEQVSDSTGAAASKLIQQQCVRLEMGGRPEGGGQGEWKRWEGWEACQK